MQGKVMSQDNASNIHDVGIDVCKDWLDVHLMPANVAERFPNTKKGHLALIRLLKRHDVRRVLMEATGKLHRSVHERLHLAGYCTVVVNPSRSRKFAESIGTLAKTDKVDARMLALFAGWNGHEATPPLDENLANLQEIVRFRAASVAEKSMLANQRSSAACAIIRKQIDRRVDRLEADVDALEAAAMVIVGKDECLARRHRILTSIPGVADVTAACLLANLHELGSLSEKEAAMLAGLAPIACESGDTIRARRIRGGRPEVRTGIFMAAVSAIQHNGPLKAVYDRLIANGKLGKVALTAVMRKLIVLANALLKADRLWSLTPPKPAKIDVIHA